eukprot:TRINITY_DN14446_c0_g2_i1.p1 TRINITY_DN14446_c0_g2~~TRINITY_DN14446_c0_g2_i1.p1  ORF type:complete len:234 (-),score=18.68 TRINITY_DN14446_c0_g2_i1:483-1184(-)
MWVSNYLLCSLYVDFIFLICVLLHVELCGWLAYSLKCLSKAVFLVTVAWRHSSRSLDVWVTVCILIASMLCPPWIYILSLGYAWQSPEQVELSALLINRIIEAPIMVVLCCSKLGICGASEEEEEGGGQVIISRNKVVPLPCFDTTIFISKTCTFAELCGPREFAGEGDMSATCCICLGMIELDEVVIQLKCEHFFHTQCASGWMQRCSTLRRDASLCPMRCALAQSPSSSEA